MICGYFHWNFIAGKRRAGISGPDGGRIQHGEISKFLLRILGISAMI